MKDKFEWWQRGIIYQVYPRSFMDSNGDGVGDLPGVISRLDYLQWLGIDAVWLAPIYPSPMADFGYDVSNYTDVHPLFGTLADMDRLIAEAHRRGLRVILDFVPNHTSDQHSWFQESRSARCNPRRDWYIWRDAKPGGGPPNNWLSVFGGGAWEWDEKTGQYYYHAFLKEQPDLNWRNPEVRKAMAGVLRFWLDRGVDGFRVDVIYHIVKDEQFRDNPRNPEYQPGSNPYREFLVTYNADRPEVHDIIAEMRAVLDEHKERMMVGEIYLPVERLVEYYGVGEKRGAHLPFNFQLITLPWNARAIGEAVQKYETLLPSYGWPNWVLGNHDKHRIVSRVGPRQARVAAMLLLTLRGTPTLYYGDEIGMHDVPIPPGRVEDPYEKNIPGLGLGRDPERTPMQWDASANAGFTTGTPWLPIAGDYRELNVAAGRANACSMLALYKRLIEIRRANPALAVGGYTPLPPTADAIGYVRTHEDTQFAVLLNFSAQPVLMAALQPGRRASVVLSTCLDRENEEVTGAVRLRSDEGLLLKLSPAT